MFECHITCRVKDQERIDLIAKNWHWKTSEIKRDPVLGDDSYYYLTTRHNNLVQMYDRMCHMANTLKAKDIEVVREKIEVIVHDTKVKKKLTFEQWWNQDHQDPEFAGAHNWSSYDWAEAAWRHGQANI